MGAFESVKNFMNKQSNHVAVANGKEAIDQHALIQANNEHQASVDHAERLQAIGSPLATAARQGLELENPNKSSSAVVFEEPAPDEASSDIVGDLENAEQGDATVYKIPREKVDESAEPEDKEEVEEQEKMVA